MKKILNALFVALLAVFTFSSCSDVPAPYEILEPGSGNQGGMQGGDAANPFGLDASNPVNDFSADFEEQPDFTPDGKFDSNLNYDYELVGWKNVAEVGDRKWTGVVFKSGEKYLRASSNKGKEASYTSWFISPAFNVEQIKDKTVSFDCAGAFFYQTTTLKVYFLELVDGVMKKTPLAVNGIPTSGENYKWVKGINVDLKDFAGKVGFIGFEYVGEGGEKKSTTYTLDNIKCGKSDSQPVDPQPEVPGEEVVVTKDAAYEESFASEFGKFTVEDKELGGLDFVWKIDTDRKYAKGSAYNGSTGVVAESWLVSPVLNLNALSKVSLNFSQCSFSAGQKEEFMLKVKNVTDNVDWSNVDFEMTTEKWKWIDNTVDLSAYAGKKIQIAFAYKNENSANANTWEVKNVKVSDGQGGGTVEPEPEPQPSGDNLLVNPGFEDWTEKLPAAWNNSKYNTGEIVKETTIKHGGKNSLKQQSDDSTQKIQQEVTLVGGKKYRISYWFLDNDPKARSRYWFAVLNDNTVIQDLNSTLQQNSGYSEDNAEWQNVVIEFTAPENANKMRYEVRTYRGADAKGTGGGFIYYDDMELVEVK